MSGVNLEQIVFGGGGALVVLLTLVQVSPIKLNPWSWIAKKIGAAVNADISKRLDGIEKKLDDHISVSDQRVADTHRARILQFNSALLRDVGHTREEFIEVLAEIDAYEAYCRDHENYPNNRAALAIENIKENYKERLKKRDFLAENRSADVASD